MGGTEKDGLLQSGDKGIPSPGESQDASGLRALTKTQKGVVLGVAGVVLVAVVTVVLATLSVFALLRPNVENPSETDFHPLSSPFPARVTDAHLGMSPLKALKVGDRVKGVVLQSGRTLVLQIASILE
ncbi:hypothetical protein KIPB_004341 [Kipferlia bialata]|uniref:Uncharacterized protein n=1 Tax=Kipferlia bialata TaxID=797122 RepID=A0A9K3CTV5_9EUKA|nr:hypothetical protein KIPB_004341 [Kipferlia bialata]|eukprot:g4341.t1